MAGKKSDYASFKILMGILLVVGIFGGIIGSFFSFSGNRRSLYERFTKLPTISIEYYYMDSCGHCKEFNKTWDEFKSKVPSESSYKLEKYNISAEGEKRGNQFDVHSAPTILAINTQDDSIIAKFTGERTVEKLLAFAASPK